MGFIVLPIHGRTGLPRPIPTYHAKPQQRAIIRSSGFVVGPNVKSCIVMQGSPTEPTPRHVVGTMVCPDVGVLLALTDQPTPHMQLVHRPSWRSEILVHERQSLFILFIDRIFFLLTIDSRFLLSLTRRLEQNLRLPCFSAPIVPSNNLRKSSQLIAT